MKTKLTLTVDQRIIKKARNYSNLTGKSISKLFEEFIDQDPSSDKSYPLKTSSQKAAQSLLELVEADPAIPTLDDKALLKKHVKQKYS